MGANFDRVKNWIEEILTDDDLNAEIDNILENFDPVGMDDYSLNVAQMKLQTSPGIPGTESLAESLAGEIERIRYVLAQIKGSQHWYSPINNSLETINDALEIALAPNRIDSGRTRSESSQPIFLVPNGAALTVTVKGASTPFVYSVDGTSVTISTDVNRTSLLPAPSSNNTAAINDAGVNDGEHTKYVGEFGTEMVIDTTGSEISNRAGQLAGFKLDNGSAVEYFIARIRSGSRLIEVKRGFFFDSADAPIPRIAAADNDVITLMKLTYVFAKTDGTLTVTYNEPVYSPVEPSSPSSGDFWFDIANDTWKKFDGVSFVDGEAHFIGYCLQNTTACVAARSAEFSHSFSEQNSVSLYKFDNTQARAKFDQVVVSVYGSLVSFGSYLPRWDFDSNLDSGVSESPNTLYYLYLSESGKQIISDLCPMDRTGDLRGLYHPFQTWRCVGQLHNDASSNSEAILSYSDTSEKNYALVHRVDTNALILKALAPPNLKFKFKAEPEQTGEWQYGALLPGTFLTVSSGSTLGTISARQEVLWVHLILFEKRAELAIAKFSVPSGELFTTTAEAGNADSATALYSYAQRDLTPVLPFAELQNEQTTAGTWAAALEYIRLYPYIPQGQFRIFTTSGSFIIPVGRSLVRYLLIGAGAAGGGNPSGASRGGGGGGGGQILEGFLPVTAAETLTITIGAGGTGGDGSGASGGSSSIAGALRTVTAYGGGGGSTGTADGGTSGSGWPGGTSTATGGGGGGGGDGCGGGYAVGGVGLTSGTGGTSGWSGGGGGVANNAGGGTGGNGGKSQFASGGTGAPASANRSSGGGGGAGLEAGGNGSNGITTNFTAPGVGGIGAGGGGGGNATNTQSQGGNGGPGYCVIMWD